MLTQQLFKKRLLDVVLTEIRQSDSTERKVIVHESVPIGAYRGLCLEHAGAAVAEDAFWHYINTVERVRVDETERSLVVDCKDASIILRRAGFAPTAWSDRAEWACLRHGPRMSALPTGP